MSEFELFFDGAWKAGISSFGFALYRDGGLIDFGYGSTFGDKNEAESFALCQGLDCFIRRIDRPKAVLHIYGDSQFIVSSAYKDPIIRSKLRQIERMTSKVEISWVPRELNKLANDLAKKLRSLQ
jgi:ribonuclease HI